MGKPIAEHQLIQAKLADMETECEAARGLLYRFGQMVDAGVDGAGAHEGLRDGKAQVRRRGHGRNDRGRADPRRLRLHQGVPVERFMRDAKITQIYEERRRSRGS